MTYGIVGLGRFGSALAMDLASAGAEIVVMDKNEERVRTLREMTEHAYVVANLDKKTLIETGIQNSGLGLVLLLNPNIFPETIMVNGMEVAGPWADNGGMLVITAWWGVWHIISGLTLAFLWRWRGRKEATEE